MKLSNFNRLSVLLIAVALISFGCSKDNNLEIEFVTQWGGTGSEPGKFSEPIGVALDTEGNIYVSDAGNNRIQKFTPDGKFVAEWGRAGSAEGEFDRPMHLAVGADGFIYVPEYGNDRVQVFNAEGEFQSQWGKTGKGPGELDAPAGVNFDSKGNVLLADFYNHRIQVLNPNGQFQYEFGAEGHEFGQLYYPTDIAVDQQGNILDGHHRAEIARKLGKKYKIGLREQAQRNFRELVVDTLKAPVRRFRTLRERSTKGDDLFWAL
ncbi:NHL repeat-containing protein, partial [candidate division KSB1 bacterium]|nr:NHL repeat-containing protein [candidate division KSB1 bacterium]